MFKNRHFKKVTNAIKTAGATDLSDGLSSKSFGINELSRYGISGKTQTVAFNQTQSLLAIVTDKSEVHIFGQQQAEVVISLNSKTAIKTLRFVKGIYLVGLDINGTIYVFSIYSKTVLSTYSPPGKVSTIETDPSLDWLLIGLQNGSIISYDIDRGILTPFRVDNLQKVVLPKESLSPVVSIQWNPRDIGTVLVGYEHSAILYSLATGEIKQSLVYEIPPNAPGGDGNISNSSRYPKLIQALYHPNSLNVLTAYDDGSLVFWDALTGKLILARSLFDIDINLPSRNRPSLVRNTKFIKLAWVTSNDPDDTTIIIAGGDGYSNEGIHNLSYLKYGVAPKYSLTSYEKMNDYYSQPKQQRLLPIQNPSPIADFLPLGQSSPYFSGNHNPNYIITVLESGEIETLSFPEGIPTFKSSIFPQSLSWIHPNATTTVATPVPRKQWLGIVSRSTKHENILKGGFPASKPPSLNEVRSALASGHSNGIVRLWDASHSELSESSVIDIDVAAALGTTDGVAIDHISFAGETVELAVSTIGGDVALFKFDVNKNFNPNIHALTSELQNLNIRNSNQQIVSLSKKTPNIKEGFLPVAGIHSKRGKVTALKNSGIGFVAIAYENGDLLILDRRGPAVIFEQNIVSSSSTGQSRYISSFEFSILAYGDDDYSSILLFAGSDKGELFTYKVLPERSGRFGAKLFDVLQTNEFGIDQLVPYKSQTGLPAIATLEEFNKLTEGVAIEGGLVISSSKDIRIINPGKTKSTHKIFSVDLYTAGLSVVSTQTSSRPYSTTVAVLLANNTIKTLSVPELREIATLPLPFQIDPRFGQHSSVLPSGDIVVRLGKTEASLISITSQGTGLHDKSSDKLYNPKLTIPYRPTIGAAQWIKGTTLISYHDLDVLIGGNRRPSPNTKESQLIQGIIKDSVEDRTNDEFSYTAPVKKRGVGAYDPTRYVMRQFQNGVDSVEEAFNDYANTASQNMNEAIGDAKTGLMKSLVRSKFGL